MKLDLETLKQVKFTFDIHSDHSIMCNGYHSLCRMIEEAEKEVNENFVQPAVIGSLPVDSAIKEIENLMERWHLARDNDAETLQGINDVLVSIGLLGWFNKQ